MGLVEQPCNHEGCRHWPMTGRVPNPAIRHERTISVHSQLFDYWSRPNRCSTSARAENFRLLTTTRFQNKQLGLGQHLICEYPQGHRRHAQNARRVKPNFAARRRISPLWRGLAEIAVTVQPSRIRERTKGGFIGMGIWDDVSQSVGFHGFGLGHCSWSQNYTSVLKYERERFGGYLVLQGIQ